MSKAAQGFSPEAYLKYVEGGNPRRTPLIGKITIYGWKQVRAQAHNNSNCLTHGVHDLSGRLQPLQLFAPCLILQ